MKTIVPSEWAIPGQLRDRFGDIAGRQRAMFAEGHLLLVLHEPPAANNRTRNARILWRDPQGAWTANSNISGSHLLKKHIASFADKIEGLERQLHNASCADDYFKLLQAVAPLHRTSRNLHSTLQQAREMTPEDRDVIVARDAAGDVERAFELIHMDAKNGLDYTVAQRAELQSQRSYEMAVSAHRLNLLAALFFPITALSSVFGMNIANGLELFSTKVMFWGVLGVGFLIGLVLTMLIAQKPTLPGGFTPIKAETPGAKKGKVLPAGLKKQKPLKQINA
ncbi:MAG: CorA family divalent cation transporter [Candidatus Obscuribacterales bacterium]|nr:CorA family divalent cation transporter [Candidatus Obscuribacterales bacterium]